MNRGVIALVACVALVAGCAATVAPHSGAPVIALPSDAPAVAPTSGTPAVAPPSGGPVAVDREHAQAMAALERWDAAAGSSGGEGGRPFIPTGELTSQIGSWEVAVGDNKFALMAGAIDVVADLPEGVPDGMVTWDDGMTATVLTVTASDALAAIKAEGGGCTDCTPLLVTDARPSTAAIATTQGPAMAPAWEFAVLGTSVIVTRIAVDPEDSTNVVPPPWDPNDPPIGISIDDATRTTDERRITVSFVGSPGPGDQPCGADYTAESVESSTAVVVIVTAHGGDSQAMCRAVGAFRTATVELAQPLGDRAVLEVKEGRPVPVAPAP